MALILFPGTDQFTAVTVSGLYDNNTDSPLFAAVGATAPTSGIQIGGTDSNGNFQALSQTPNGFLNVNAQITNATVDGTLTNNTAAPIGDNLGVLPAVAATTYTTVSYTTGNQVLLVTDLHGALNNDMQAVAGVALGATAVVAFGTAPAAVPVQAVNASIFSGTTSITNTGGALNVNISNTSGTPIFVEGNLTNNNAAPNAFNVGVLPAIAETAYNTVTYTTGDQVLPVTDLHGALNTDEQAVAGVQLGATAVVAFGTAPAAVNVQAVNSSIFAGTTALTATGSSLNVNVTNTIPTAGSLSNNTAAPIADNVGVLGFIAETAYTTVTYTTGNQVLAVTDLHGAINTDLQALAGTALGGPTVWGTAPTAEEVQGVNAFIFNTNVTPVFVTGTLSNNTAAPIADNFGALIAVTNSGAFPAVTLPAYTAGFQELLRVSQGGSLVTIPADEEYASSINYFADDSGFTTLITLPNATLVPLISIQANSAAIAFMIREVTGYGDGSQIKFVLVKNPQTLTGAAFTVTGIPTGSHIKRDITATAVTIGTGSVVWSSMAASAPAHNEMLMQALAAGAPGDTYTLAAQKFGTGSSKAFGSVRWSEEAAAI